MQIGSLSLQSTEQPHACHVDVPLDEPPALWLMIKRSSPKHKRHVKNALKEMKLTEFLMENHFFLDEINEPRPLAHRADEVEQLWPIHVAAQLGDRELLRTLLRAGADSTQVSSAGRTSLDIAREEDCEGSHQEVIHMLSSNVRCCSSKALLAQDSQDRPTLKTG
ncbi:unnamed protein product [Cladocopium goreaui]|uniref:Caskin-2 n=1 Tax=Cladocopium goreaui TaxID=2562237 RepID=A0A9P1FQQ5_9DINO|nr:unnamed protein product [Cladocopium goreaui]